MADTQTHRYREQRRPHVAGGMLALALLLAACGSDIPDGTVPDSLLEQPLIFSGTLISVSDAQDERLGSLKLYEMTPANVRGELRSDDLGPALILHGCQSSCDAGGFFGDIARLPLRTDDGTAPTDDTSVPRIDYQTVGEHLDLFWLIEIDWADVVLEGTTGTFVSWQDDTFIFDVQYDLSIDDGTGPKSVAMTVRWYLLPEARLDADFESRELHEQVGYLRTWRTATPLLKRYSTRDPIHYYIKNVPETYHATFAAAFEDWNDVFEQQVGLRPLTYEFVAADDPRSDELVNGDIRHHIMEWDLDNKAWYGGLASAQANQKTGEVYASGILIQGPGIVDLYTEWFASAQGSPATERALARQRVELYRRARARAQRSNGDHRHAGAGDGPQHDPLGYIFAFDTPPAGTTLEQYLDGYFREIVAHELGHNIGLHHNFRGSLADDGAARPSSSVMEYTWRVRRNLTRIGDYDVAALAYGYLGTAPGPGIDYCANDHLASLSDDSLSPECSFQDAGPDPFAFFREQRMRRAIDLGIGRAIPGQAPEWQLADLVEPFAIGAQGMLLYASTALATADDWTHFYLDGDRPTVPGSIQQYVIGELQDTMCDPSIVEHIEATYAVNPEAGLQAGQTWDGLVQHLVADIESVGLTVSMCDPDAELSFSL